MNDYWFMRAEREREEAYTLDDWYDYEDAQACEVDEAWERELERRLQED